jgi:hypothetical protein
MELDTNHYSEVFYNKTSLEFYYYEGSYYKQLSDIPTATEPCMTCKIVIPWLKDEMSVSPLQFMQKQIVLSSMKQIFSDKLTNHDCLLFGRMMDSSSIAICKCTYCNYFMIREPLRGESTWQLKVVITPNQTSRMAEGARTHFSGPTFIHKMKSDNLDLLDRKYMIGGFIFESMDELRALFLLYYICERDSYVRWPSRLNTMSSPVNYNKLVGRLIGSGICHSENQSIEVICLNFGECVCDQENHDASDDLAIEYKRWKCLFRAGISPSMQIQGYDVDFNIGIEQRIEQNKAFIMKVPEIEALSEVLKYRFPHSTWEKLIIALQHPQVSGQEQQLLAIKGDIFIKMHSIQCCQNRRYSPADHQNNVSKYQSNRHLAERLRKLGIDTIVFSTIRDFQPLNEKSLATIFEAIIGACADTIGLHGLNELNRQMLFSGFYL